MSVRAQLETEVYISRNNINVSSGEVSSPSRGSILLFYAIDCVEEDDTSSGMGNGNPTSENPTSVKLYPTSKYPTSRNPTFEYHGMLERRTMLRPSPITAEFNSSPVPSPMNELNSAVMIIILRQGGMIIILRPIQRWSHHR